MMQSRRVELPEHVDSILATLQAQINTAPTYADRVQQARQRFEAENRPGNEVFDVIRNTLASMCTGARRCMYCEDSTACEVEHFRPKTFYPELVFIWLNYLYSCSLCNRIKRNHFRILCGVSEYVDLVRGRNEPATAPRDGVSMLIDPRSENPVHYMTLDLVDTFWFVPRHAEGTLEYSRAKYTIERLKLNERDYLPQARQEAYEGYRARLQEYVHVRGTPKAEHLARALSRCGHPSVWVEMKAQASLQPDLAPLFAAAPEASSW